jgi:16S rRNA C967 or C1407 C5-methylase (RsmB/RsmF family)
MDPTQLTVETLARLLREAERAHGEYEKELGRRDEDWPSWYADYILKRLGEAGAEA